LCKLVDKLEDRKVLFYMWKISLLVLTFFFPYNAYAGLEGSGDIKLSLHSLSEFEKYLSDYNHNKKAVQKSGKGLVFSISADGQHSGYYYCFSGRSCVPDEPKVKRFCESRAIKSGNKISCNTFAIGRKIVWNNLNRTVPRNVDIKVFIKELGPASGIMISDAKPPSNFANEQKKQLKSLLDAGIMTKKEYDEAIKKIK